MHHALHQRKGLRRVQRLARASQRGHMLRQLGRRQVVFLRTHDARVVGGQHVVADQQLLVQLFARAQAGAADLHVALRVALVAHLQAGQVNHAPRQVDDAHRLAHVQHEHVAALPHRPGLDHQLRGFGDGHEIAGNVGVRQRHRAAAGDLLLEQRHHRAGAAQHIAKAHHHKAGTAARRVARLQRQLGQALGGAHHIRWPHRFVSRN